MWTCTHHWFHIFVSGSTIRQSCCIQHTCFDQLLCHWKSLSSKESHILWCCQQSKCSAVQENLEQRCSLTEGNIKNNVMKKKSRYYAMLYECETKKPLQRRSTSSSGNISESKSYDAKCIWYVVNSTYRYCKYQRQLLWGTGHCYQRNHGKGSFNLNDNG